MTDHARVRFVDELAQEIVPYTVENGSPLPGNDGLTGICENMPPESRTDREEILLQLIQDELQARGGSGDFDEVLTAVAAAQRIAISQVKHGLNRGITLGSLGIMANDSDPRSLFIFQS